MGPIPLALCSRREHALVGGAPGDSGFDDGFDALPDGTAFSVAGVGGTVAVALARGYAVGQVYAPCRDADSYASSR